VSEVYHLVLPSLWQARSDEPYRADSLQREGFIHCSYVHQVAASANRFYATAAELLVLTISPARLTSPLKAEAAGSGELFPHVYGPINRDAVTSARPLDRDAAGQWVFFKDEG
jgi:glutathione S-transferase